MYLKQTWANGATGGTPLNATRLQYIEDGLQAAAAQADNGVTLATAAYSATNPPPYPVTSVAGRGAAVTLTAADIGAGTFPGAVSFTGLATLNAGSIVAVNQSIQFGQSSGNRAYIQGSGTGLYLRGGTGGTILRNNADTASILTVDDIGNISLPNNTGISLTTTAGNPVYLTAPTDGYFKVRGGLNGTYFANHADSAVILHVFDNGELATHGTGSALSLHGRDNDAQLFQWYVNGNVARLYSSTAAADKLTVDSSGLLTINGSIAGTGSLTLNGATQGIEHGAMGVSNTPFFDWHSGAVGVDYDVRMQVSGGNGTSGHGFLDIYAAQVILHGNLANTPNLVVSGNPANRGTDILLQDTGTAGHDKYLRVNSNHFQILNNAYSVAILDIDDSGNTVITGSLTLAQNFSLSLSMASGNAGYIAGSGTQLKMRGGSSGFQFRNNADTSDIALLDNVGNFTAASLAVTAATTSTTAPTGGAAGALPANPVGYITVPINGTNRKIPYYT